MERTVIAVFSGGVFRPTVPVDLPEGAQAEVTFSPVSPAAGDRPASTWPLEYFERTAGALAGEALERPFQGEVDERDNW